MSLKQARFYVEPAWLYKGTLVKPMFGSAETCMENIMDWVYEHEHPQGPTCYALWKITQQDHRINALEDIVKALMEEVRVQATRYAELQQVVESHTIELRRQESAAHDLRQYQACQIEEVQEKINALEPIYATELPYAKVVETETRVTHQKRPFLSMTRPRMSTLPYGLNHPDS